MPTIFDTMTAADRKALANKILELPEHERLLVLGGRDRPPGQSSLTSGTREGSELCWCRSDGCCGDGWHTDVCTYVTSAADDPVDDCPGAVTERADDPGDRQ